MIVRPPSFKLLTLVITTLFVLLSFSLSAYALPIRYWLATRDADEQPYPAASPNTSYFIVLKTAFGFVLIPIFVKSSRIANSVAAQKSSDSRRANEVIE